MYRILAAATTVALIAAGAVLGTGTDAGRGAATDPIARADDTGLAAYTSCGALLERTRAQAIAMTGPWRLAGAGYSFAERDALVAPAAREAGAVTGAPSPDTLMAPQQGRDFSATNVQEEGVDEPDVIKTDGRRMFAVSGTVLHSLDVTGGSAKHVGRLDLSDMGGTGGALLLLSGDRLLVLASEVRLGATATTPDTVPGEAVTMPVLPPQGTALRLVDVSDPANMEVVETLHIEGHLVSARLTRRSVRVVISTPPEPLPLPGPQASGTIAEVVALMRNRRAVATSDLDTWLPSYAVEREGRSSSRRQLVSCEDVRHPAAFTGLGTLTVATLDLDRGVTPIDTDAVQTDGQIVYGSPTSLYVATPRWTDPVSPRSGGPGGGTTQIHRFDTSDATETTYRGSGEVGGHLLGQWSMSEREGVLRVASTDEPTWSERGGGIETQSYVTTLDVREDRLAPRARVGGLGRGERIYSVRFIGDMGYVVTFRQTDPLYTVDLSDPDHPRVRGELEIPGYSAYLHPVGEGLLLGVGQDATLEGRVRGTQVSLFDVSDPASPRRIRHLTFPGAWSEAEGDHHAFLHWPATGLTVIPVQEADAAGMWTTRAVGLAVRPDEGIREIGRVTHPAANGAGGAIHRSAVIGDALYTVSEAGVEASDLDDLDERTWVPFT
jgi:hypothetical protein